MSNEYVQNAARQVLQAASKFEAYLKKATGKAYTLKKPMLFSGATLTAKFVGRKAKKPKIDWKNPSAEDLDKWMAGPSMPDGFILELTYDAGMDLYNVTSYYIDGFGKVSDTKKAEGLYFDQAFDPNVVFPFARSKKESISDRMDAVLAERSFAGVLSSGGFKRKKSPGATSARVHNFVSRHMSPAARAQIVKHQDAMRKKRHEAVECERCATEDEAVPHAQGCPKRPAT